MNELNIMTWNIRRSASLGWDSSYTLSPKLIEEIFRTDADVMVLTEFVAAPGLDDLLGALRQKGYLWLSANASGKNGILMAVRRELVNAQQLKQNIYSSSALFSTLNGCNLLRAELPLQSGALLTVLGCRMETGAAQNLTAQYNEQRRCFDRILLPAVLPARTHRLFIVCGDFNNARCLASLQRPFDPNDYLGRAQCNYNLNLIKDAFYARGFHMADQTDAGQPIATHTKGTMAFPLDHIFVRGLTPVHCGVRPSACSDHAILWAKCTL